MKKLYNIYYIGSITGDKPEYEITTDNFNKWHKQHNIERWDEVTCGDEGSEDHIDRECSCIEDKDDFSVEYICLNIFGRPNIDDLIQEYKIKKKKLRNINSPIMGYLSGIRDGKVKQLTAIISDLNKIKCT